MFKNQYFIFTFLLFIGFISYCQTDFSEVDNRVVNIGFSPKEELAKNITNEFKTDIEKVRALFVWITENISYDFELYESDDLKKKFYISESNVIDKTLERKKAICSGYSMLFKKLCNDLDIECEVISGFSKQWLDSFISKNVTDHAWNAVKINDNWFLIDTTWASKNEENNIRDDFWFMTNPNHFIYSHYPKDEKWTLLDKRMTKEEFDKLPVINNRSFFEDNIRVLVPNKNIIDVEKERLITFELETVNTDRWITLRGYPWETYASKNSLEFPSDEEYSKLSDEERDKYNRIIPSVEIIEKMISENKIIIKAKIVSENIESLDLIVEGNTIATIKLNLK